MITWVLLRGWARDSRHWDSFPARLAGASPRGTRVITLDLPGNGVRHRDESPTTVEGMVSAYRVQLRALDVNEPIHLLGLSLGAMVAVEWAARDPGAIASAVLVNCSAGGMSSWYERLRPLALGHIAASVLAPNDIARESRIATACTNLNDVRALALRWAAYRVHARTSARNALRQLAAAAHWKLPDQRLAVPTLVLASTADRVVSLECSIAIARHWSLPLALHPCAGHEIAADDPAWLVRQCTRWAAADVTDASPMS